MPFIVDGSNLSETQRVIVAAARKVTPEDRAMHHLAERIIAKEKEGWSFDGWTFQPIQGEGRKSRGYRSLRLPRM